jgi:uncharacterized protein with ParB-like and HNH nuclease domain
VQVRETSFKQLVQGEKQFRIPLWQRQYSWSREDHKLLWRDILEQYDHLTHDEQATTHFIGSFVLSPLGGAASEPVSSYLVVDGQQRITTLMLILCALRDIASKTNAQATERINELYLINKFQTKTKAPDVARGTSNNGRQTVAVARL